MTSWCEHVLGGLIGVLIFQSCVVVGSPTEEEKWLSMVYKVHHRLRHRDIVSAPS